MKQSNQTVEPDWDTPISFALTPSLIFHTLFASADTVLSGFGTCSNK